MDEGNGHFISPGSSFHPPGYLLYAQNYPGDTFRGLSYSIFVSPAEIKR